MKDHGPGFSILNAGGTSTINAYKQELNRTPPAPVREFKQLKVQAHPRAEQMAQYAAIPSWKP